MISWLNKDKVKIIVGTLILMVSLTSIAGLWERPELVMYDTWFKIRGMRPSPGEVVVVGIDDRSIKEIGLLPWPRRVHADLIEKLKEAQVIGFDIILDTPGVPEDNHQLAEAMEAHGKVVLATMFSFEQEEGIIYQRHLLPTMELAMASSGLGFINTPEDLDNVVRRLTMIDVNSYDIPFPCFSLAVLMTQRDLSPNDLKIIGEKSLAVGDMLVPLDQKNQTMIDFWGPAGAIKTYSYIDVLKGNINLEELAGKIILVGPTSATERDVKNNPFTRGNMVLAGTLPVPGVEVHASAINTYISGAYFTRASLLINTIFLLFIGILATTVINRAGNPWRGLIFLLSIVITATLAVYLAWYYGHYWLNIATPVGLAMLIYTGVTAEKLVRTEIERRRTRGLFARYVSPTVVEEVLKQSQDIALGGKRVELTIIFSDIRGFTSFSENKQPEYIVQRLNDYFTEMTAIIFKHGGTLDKYLGDGLMAFFGAPVHYQDHADRALASAVEMVARLAELNKRWQEKNEPIINIGIGINSGPVIVGNVGSLERMDYTIIGEDVNLASRLEGMNKEFKTNIIVSERSFNYLHNKEILTYLDKVNIRGMATPIGVYTLLK